MTAKSKFRKPSHWILPVLVLMLAYPPHLVVGETIDNNQAIADIFQNTLNEGGADALANLADDNPAFFQDIQAQVPPAPSPTSGRKEKASGAQGAAIFGAVMAFASCAMMMAAARKMEPGPERTMMMAQAMQQCAQGAQNAANAGQNGDAADAVTSAAPLPGVQNAIPVTLPKSDKGDAVVSSSNRNNDSSTPQISDDFNITQPEITVPGIGVTQAPGEIRDDFEFTPVANVEPPKSLPAINHPKIGFNEDQEESGKPTILSGGGLLRGALDNGKVPDPSALANGGVPDRGTLDGLVKDSGLNNGGGGAAGGSAAGKLSLNGLLDAYGNKAGDIGAPPGDIVQMPLDKKAGGGKRLNIFEYGAYRYRRLAYDDGRIRTRIVTDRGLASTAAEPQIQAASVFK
ncbi:MAG: hypothetical protein KDD51_09410 [Bdellovibrionales bacterium]|nr:hypothetical protein [Bdellovibrionales bacterium]